MKTEHCPVYKQLASSILARKNCIDSGNEDWFDNHSLLIEHIQQNYLPSGSGIDSGCTINVEKYQILEIKSSYHTMDENGCYGRWTDFTVKVKPSLIFDFDISIIGNFGKHQMVKDYLYDVFNDALAQPISRDEIKSIYNGWP